MTIAKKVTRFLASKGVPYKELRHETTATSQETAHVADVPDDRMAKAVVLEDHDGYVMAVVPASHQVDSFAVEHALERHLQLATEQELADIFEDCARGAIPPFGTIYGLDTIVDDHLFEMPDVYLEAGDHRTLIQVDQASFRRLFDSIRHSRISYPH